MAAFALLAASCGQELENGNDVTASKETGTAQISVHVNDFSISQEDFAATRATTDATSYSGMKAMTLAFYNADGTEQYNTTQLKGSIPVGETFGTFNLSLPYGTYTMIVMGYGSDSPVVLNSQTEAVFEEGRSRETFVYTQSVTVTNSTPLELSATLSRIVSRLMVLSTDGRPANLNTIRFKFSKGGMSFNPVTGLAASDTGFTVNTQTTKEVGETTNMTVNFFLASDEETMDVTIETLDADDNVLFSKIVKDVPFKRNRITKLTGKMYSTDVTASSFLLNSDWLSEENKSF